jgi:transcriptional regulator with XRE-family HTH domain
MQQSLGEKIRKARRGKGLTQRELAKEVGVDHTIISRIESNDREASPAAILQLCTFLELWADADAELSSRGIMTHDIVVDSPRLSDDDRRQLATIERKLARLPEDRRRVALAAMAGVVAGVG